MSPRTSTEIPGSKDGHETRPAVDKIDGRNTQGKMAEASNLDGTQRTTGSYLGIINVDDTKVDPQSPAMTSQHDVRSLIQSTGVNTCSPMVSSTTTTKPPLEPGSKSISGHTQHAPSSEPIYSDPTSYVPMTSQCFHRNVTDTTSKLHQPSKDIERSPTRSEAGSDEQIRSSEQIGDVHAQSSSELQDIMQQFSKPGKELEQEEVMPQRLDIAESLLHNPVQHPPRNSSLEAFNTAISSTTQSIKDLKIAPSFTSAQPGSYKAEDSIRKGSMHSFSSPRSPEGPPSSSSLPVSPPSLPLSRPPEPEPEPDLPFDFHRFLEQLRHRTADPVAKFLRSFLQEFGKKQWMVHEQIKIIGDFLTFITNKMAQCEVWREVSDAEFDNAREGMEKLVMNRLYTQTFSPAIPPPQPMPGSKAKRKGGERSMGPGRRGQHQEDVERDEILAQKVWIYSWVRECHLDISPLSDSGKRFLLLAQQELLKIKAYRAPRDKIICVLNCCKVIFGLLKHAKTDSSADSFMPLLIYVVLQSNPEHMVSNVQYILRFRNQEKLSGEAGYYLSSLLGAVQFIENLDRTTLTISDEEFEARVEAAVSNIAEKHRAATAQNNVPPQPSEKPLPIRPEVRFQSSMDAELSMPRTSTSPTETEVSDEKAAISGLLRSIQRPLTSIGRMFSEDSPSLQSGAAWTPQAGSTPRITTPRMTPPPQVFTEKPRNSTTSKTRDRENAEEAAARQASAEATEAHRLQRAERSNLVDRLAGMFPDLDREIISDVVTQKEGRIGLAVDACLALSA